MDNCHFAAIMRYEYRYIVKDGHFPPSIKRAQICTQYVV